MSRSVAVVKPADRPAFTHLPVAGDYPHGTASRSARQFSLQLADSLLQLRDHVLNGSERSLVPLQVLEPIV